MNTERQVKDRENLRLLITEFNDGPMGSADDFAWRRHLKTYEGLLAEVKRLRSDLEINYQARKKLEFETLAQQVLIYKLMGEEE